MVSSLPESVADPLSQALEAGNEDAVLSLAIECDDRGSSSHARRVLMSGHEALPQSPRVAVRLLEHLTRYKGWRQIEDVVQSADSEVVRRVEFQFALGCAYEAQRRWEEASEVFAKAFRAAPDEVEPLVRLARSLRVQGRTDEAIEAINSAKKHHKSSAPVQASLGYALIEKQRFAEAATSFQRASHLEPEWGPYLDDLAGALMLSERWGDAAKVASKSLKRRKRNERAWTVYAVAHQNLGVRARAEQGYRNAVRAARVPSRAMGNFGLFLRNDPGRVLEAVKFLRAAHEAHPEWDEVSEALRELLDASS